MRKTQVRSFALLLLLLGMAGGCGKHRVGVTFSHSKPNLVLVTVDSFRADRVRLISGRGPKLPNLELMAANGTLFTNFWAVCPWTSPSLDSIFTGLYPPSHGVVWPGDTPLPGLPTLPRLLKEAGYKVATYATFADMPYFQGIGWPKPKPKLYARWAVDDMMRWALSTDRPKPFAAWIHLIEPHLPYGSAWYGSSGASVKGSPGLIAVQLHSVVPLGSTIFAPGDRERLTALYDSDLVLMDATLGYLLASLRRNGFYDKTLIVLVADHGEELLDHGWVGHASTSMYAKLAPEVLRVPLLMMGPGIPKGQRCSTLAQQVDILPTLIKLLGLPEAAGLEGEPLLPLGKHRTKRKLAFFHSSLGGNLTTSEQQGQWVAGAGRDDCIGWVTSLGDTGCWGRCKSHGKRFVLAAKRWVVEEERRRLKMMELHSPPEKPSEEEILSFPIDPKIVIRPGDGETLYWRSNGGVITLEWASESNCWVEYRVGKGPLSREGIFLARTSFLKFGPFEKKYWTEIARFSPFRFRIICPEDHKRSPWVSFAVSAE